ncbi:unnamed protein product [Cuscuta europaea]|uniref:Uncharacterized protein n=1 Tax=Cuscuta europaea TaxID=41803 RepID=A0A9P0ZCP3_CUSEU|nr:unnamed protein product [Cuscuta europaea]
MNRMSFVAQAAKKVEAELKAAEGSKNAGEGPSDVAKKLAASKKKKRSVVVDEGQKMLVEAELQPSKSTKRPKKASSGASADAVQTVDEGGHAADVVVVEDLTEGLSLAPLSQPPPLNIEAPPSKTGSDREVVRGLYGIVVRYPLRSGVFNEIMSGNEVISQDIPEETGCTFHTDLFSS